MAKKILFIEDDFEKIKGLAENLEVIGYEVDNAINGTEGIDKVKSGEYNFVIVDLIMPPGDKIQVEDERESGIKVCEVIRNEVSKTLPIIILSVASQDDEIGEALEQLNINEYLEKPILPSVLEKAVRELIGNPKG